MKTRTLLLVAALFAPTAGCDAAFVPFERVNLDREDRGSSFTTPARPIHPPNCEASVLGCHAPDSDK